MDGILQQMARILDSNEQFELDDSVQLSFTQVRAAPQGSGKKRKLKLGHAEPQTFKRLKGSVVTVKNKDQLCFRRAIVTTKAKSDRSRELGQLRKGSSDTVRTGPTVISRG